MNSKKPHLRLAAACAILGIVPADNAALSMLKKALLSQGQIIPKKRRRQESHYLRVIQQDEAMRTAALRACVEIRVGSKALVPPLIKVLEGKEEEARIFASYILGQIGPDAADAIPALEELLSKGVRGSGYNFRSHYAAANALAKIGKGSLPVLIRATDKQFEGPDAAAFALGWLGKDAAPAIPTLIRILNDKDNPARLSAVMSLGQLGRHARAARQALLKASRDEDAEFQLIVYWALNKIGQ